MIDADELASWLRLLESPGIGRESARKLLAAFGAPDAVLSASAAALREVLGPTAAAALGAPSDAVEALIAATFSWLNDAAPRDVITLGDPRYPEPLLHTADPPVLLYAQGRIDLLARPCLGVVGSRNPTAQGGENARAFSTHLSRAGLTIVSGLALGIDAAAHLGGLDGGSSTIAVVATGLDRVYPRRHRDLAHRIAADGLLLSEYALGTPALQNHFPTRNRLIAGLSRGVLVVEAAVQSGSLITARLAVEAGRDVFAIPGSIHSPQSRGCHALIKQGAKLVDRAEDILDELQVEPVKLDRTARPEPPDPLREEPLLAAIGHDPVTMDALVARTGMSPALLNVRLLELELEGHVARLPGQRFQRIARV